jgi:radical SAM superfamily enzyme YgiQ (UPF0313 family)
VDFLNVLILTPLPGTRLWDKMEEEGRILSNRFPEDWKYFTLTLPVGRYKNFSREEILGELETCVRRFYSVRGIVRRVARSLLLREHPFLVFAGNLSYRKNENLSRKVYEKFRGTLDRLPSAVPIPATGENMHVLGSSAGVRESSLK